MDRSSGQKINKDTVALNGTLDQMDLINIFRAFYPKQQNVHIFTWNISRIDHMLEQITSLNKYKIEIIPSIFPNHNAKKLEINHKKNTEKYTRYESK